MTKVGDVFWDGRGRQVEVVRVENAGDYIERVSKETIAAHGSSLSRAGYYAAPTAKQREARAREVVRLNKPIKTGAILR